MLTKIEKKFNLNIPALHSYQKLLKKSLLFSTQKIPPTQFVIDERRAELAPVLCEIANIRVKLNYATLTFLALAIFAPIVLMFFDMRWVAVPIVSLASILNLAVKRRKPTSFMAWI